MRQGRPDPFKEIRPTGLRPIRAPNFWSRSPVIRIDLGVGVYDHISSADVPGLPERLLELLPGLVEHRCSVGRRGGFLERLRDGTYAPHVLEHLALELQGIGGDELGFGRARGGDREGEYTVVFGYRRRELGILAGELALELVRHAFAGTLDSVEIPVAKLRRAGESAEERPPTRSVACVVTGPGSLEEAVSEIADRTGLGAARVIAISPSEILREGLSIGRCGVAAILGTELSDVPERYRAPDRARQLVSVVADVVGEDGIVLAPAGDRELHERILNAGVRLGTFAVEGDSPPDPDPHLRVTSTGGSIRVFAGGEELDGGTVRAGVPLAAQLVGAAAAAVMRQGAGAR